MLLRVSLLLFFAAVFSTEAVRAEHLDYGYGSGGRSLTTPTSSQGGGLYNALSTCLPGRPGTEAISAAAGSLGQELNQPPPVAPVNPVPPPTLPPSPSTPVTQTEARKPDVKAGAEIYNSRCLTCHGAEARAQRPAPNLDDGKPHNFEKLILDDVMPKGAKSDPTKQLTPEQKADLIEYLRTAKGPQPQA